MRSLLERIEEPRDASEEVDSFVEAKDATSVVRHTCIIPKDFRYLPLSQTEENIRCTYPFVLDVFQVLALRCLERDESILVSAHTSAGKTLVAEYAIHLSIHRKQRVIYTSPIKALSNQKYRELNEKFGDVGLMTGDVTLNPDSTCIVMTTEILRNMIYRGSEILRETHFVVFDEVHYMRDRERGVVWEETIILLPSSTRFIFLSATIPNAEEFARWIVSIHHQPCHVIYTEKRPTPLEHYIYSNVPLLIPQSRHRQQQPAERKSRMVVDSAIAPLAGTSPQIELVVDRDGNFRMKKHEPVSKQAQTQRGRRKEKINVIDIVNILRKASNLPTIFFSFRRKECEEYALCVEKEFDFNSEEEKKLVQTIFDNALNSLREEDKSLPQIMSVLSILKRGIGIHHSGLLPIIKEIIEILFQENLLKVLFATETFSIGLNMPAKSVVFTSIKKFDGKTTRLITSGEYIQMSGRAGRRGRDKIGNVVMALESTTRLEEKEIQSILHGPSNSLDSAFRLSYNTILNLLRLDGMDEEHIIRHSFLQFRQELKDKQIYLRTREVLEYVEEVLENLNVSEKAVINNLESSRGIPKGAESLSLVMSQMEKYYGIIRHLAEAPAPIYAPSTYEKLMQPGRILEISCAHVGSYRDIEYFDASHQNAPEMLKQKCMVVDGSKFEVVTEKKEIRTLLPGQIIFFSKSKLDIPSGSDPVPLAREYFEFTGAPGKRRSEDPKTPQFYTIPELEGFEEAHENTLKMQQAARTYLSALETYFGHDSGPFRNYLTARSVADSLCSTISGLTQKRRETRLLMIEEYKSKKNVLRALSYITDNTVLIKGKVASEISTADELVLTEMLFGNELDALSAGRICSLLSCVVFDEKVDDVILSPESQDVHKILVSTANKLVEEFERLDPNFKRKEYMEKLSPSLMDVVFLWSEGYSFKEICTTTEVFEGSIIRCFRRLEEVLKEMCRASKVIGNVDMENKFSAAISLVKRDIVFANSLYL